jgi:predicted nuclease of restriction endonuclease-like (RecB) superfamily
MSAPNTLERQINTLYYERLLASSDRRAVAEEASGPDCAATYATRLRPSDPVMLEFLGIPGVGEAT